MKILIIKHGAFGDMINATGAFSLLRQSFPNAEITLLTSQAFEKLAHEMNYFQHIWVDERSKNLFRIWDLVSSLRAQKFDWVFDLQNSKRTSIYYHFFSFSFSKPPFWSGIAAGCSHRQTRLDRQHLHAYPRFADQLACAGLDLKGKTDLYPDMSWLKADIEKFQLPSRFIILVPGSSKTGAYKRWSFKGFKDLALWILTQQITPILIGGPDEKEITARLKKEIPEILDLSGQTHFLEIGAIQKKAIATVGNDTGPVHLAAAVGCPTLILWSKASSPHVFAPRGKNIKVLYYPEIQMLPSQRVIQTLQNFLWEQKMKDEIYLKRILYRATYRGGKEADHILGNFARQYSATLSTQDLRDLDDLLLKDDSDIFNWLNETETIPPLFDTNILQQLREYFNSIRF